MHEIGEPLSAAACVNCRSPFKEGFAPVSSITVPVPREAGGDEGNEGREAQTTLTILDALSVVFISSGLIRLKRIAEEEKCAPLSMCGRCAGTLSKLYSAHNQLLFYSDPAAQICRLIRQIERWHRKQQKLGVPPGPVPKHVIPHPVPPPPLVLSVEDDDEEDVIIPTSDVGLQTDLVEDPDVYYFAGGRHVGCQPDYDSECGPLEPFLPGVTVIVMSTSEIDMGVEAEVDPVRAPTPKPPGTPTEPIETKSSATQLSVGSIPGIGTKEEESKESSSSKHAAAAGPTPTTFAEKAKKGMLRPYQAAVPPVKPFLAGTPRPKPVAGSVVPVSNLPSTRGSKTSVNVNYRSNIASRCRTAAVNKGTQQQQGLPQVQSSPSASPRFFSPSTAACSPTTAHKPPPTNTHFAVNSKSSTPRRPPTPASANQPEFTTHQRRKSFNNSTGNLSPSHPNTHPHLQAQAQDLGSQAGRGTPQGKPALPGNRFFGISRSKSMINPVYVSNVKDKQAGFANVRNTGESPHPHPHPAVEVMKRRAVSNVGEDGWETVRARSNRSKWSLSSCSSSNNDLLAVSTPIPEGKCIEGAAKDKQGGTLWKDEESRLDEEEIKQNEEALDSAIREEELIEEELLQMEQEMERLEEIDSESRGGVDESTVSEPDNVTASSPDTLDVSEDCENDPGTHPDLSLPEPLIEKEVKDCFFIDIVREQQQPSNCKSEEFSSREPDRIIALREKLMSPAKRCDGAETLRRHQAKLAKAERNREMLLQAKYNRYVELSDRFKALNETTKRLVEERAKLVSRAEERRRRAVEKRQLYIKSIKRKAHDEDSKAKEIAFINLLEAQNKRHDYLASAHEIEERLQWREEERKIKLEERALKAACVLKRQSRIRSNWQSKLDQMQERRQKAQERIMREKQERAKERSELAQEKARDREERLSALNAAKQAKKEELKKVIQQKQQDTARRHEENMELIRQKAIELSGPRSSEDQSSVRMCTLCKVVIQSEVQELAHLRGRAHLEAVKRMEQSSTVNNSTMSQAFGLKFITDVLLDKVEPGITTDKNRLKTLKKQCKKIIQKLVITGQEFESSYNAAQVNGKQYGDQKALKSKTQRNIREMDRLISMFVSEKGSVHLATSLDRLLAETRKIAVRNPFIQDSLVELGLFRILQNLLDCNSPDLPSKVFVGACNLLIGATFQNLANTLYIIRSTCICNILEFAARRWNTLVPEDNRWLCGSPVGTNEPLPVDPVVESVVELLFNILNVIPDPFIGIRNPKQGVASMEEIKLVEVRSLDILGYLVGSGIIDRLSVYCTGVRGPVDSQPQVAGLLKASLDFLTMLIYALQSCWDQKKPDSTQLLAALESSEIAGAISMSYSLLLHQGAPTRPRLPPTVEDGENGDLVVPPPPGPLSASVLKSTLCLINSIAMLDIHILQDVLGSEAVSLQFRHISSQLLWQVLPHREKDLLLGSLINQLLIALGNFTVLNPQNQVTIQSGQTPTVLQQLCSLPQEYFQEPKLTRHLFPTLVAATYGCPENQDILTQLNIPVALLDGFMKSDFAKFNSITKRLIPLQASQPAQLISQTHRTTTNGLTSPSKKPRKSQSKK